VKDRDVREPEAPVERISVEFQNATKERKERKEKENGTGI
jgi:hypothetical protein